MRIHSEQKEWSEYDVFVNGTKIENCFEADDETNTAWVHDTNTYNGYSILKGNVEFKKKTPRPLISADDIACDQILAEQLTHGLFNFYADQTIAEQIVQNMTDFCIEKREVEAEWIEEPYFTVRDTPKFEYSWTPYQEQEITGVMIDGTTFEFNTPVHLQAGDTLEFSMELLQDGTFRMIKMLHNGR